MLKDENSRLKELVGAVKRISSERSNKDIELICTYLRRIESFKRFCTEALLTLIEMIELSVIKKGTMNQFDFNNVIILLKGQVFVMTHDRLNKDLQAQITKPIELPLDSLLDPGREDGVYLKMLYYGEDTIELRLDKTFFRR